MSGYTQVWSTLGVVDTVHVDMAIQSVYILSSIAVDLVLGN